MFCDLPCRWLGRATRWPDKRKHCSSTSLSSPAKAPQLSPYRAAIISPPRPPPKQLSFCRILCARRRSGGPHLTCHRGTASVATAFDSLSRHSKWTVNTSLSFQSRAPPRFPCVLSLLLFPAPVSDTFSCFPIPCYCSLARQVQPPPP